LHKIDLGGKSCGGSGGGGGSNVDDNDTFSVARLSIVKSVLRCSKMFVLQAQYTVSLVCVSVSSFKVFLTKIAGASTKNKCDCYNGCKD